MLRPPRQAIFGCRPDLLDLRFAPSALIAASSSSRVSRNSKAAALAFRVALLYLTQANTKSEVSPRESTVTIGGETRRGHTGMLARCVSSAVGRGELANSSAD